VRSPRLALSIRGAFAHAPTTMATKIVLKVISEIIARQRIA
jgi:hypothetical protein